MKTLTITNFAAIALMSVLAIPTLAAPPTLKHDNARLKNQAARIRQGVKSGQLTKREANLVRQREAAIRLHEAHDRVTGGKVTLAERRSLNRQLNRASWNIFRQKHDGQHR